MISANSSVEYHASLYSASEISSREIVGWTSTCLQKETRFVCEEEAGLSELDTVVESDVETLQLLLMSVDAVKERRTAFIDAFANPLKTLLPRVSDSPQLDWRAPNMDATLIFSPLLFRRGFAI